MQRQRLGALKGRRDGKEVEDCLESLKEAASGKENLLPHILKAVKAYATVGEVSSTLAEVFGEHKEKVWI